MGLALLVVKHLAQAVKRLIHKVGLGLKSKWRGLAEERGDPKDGAQV